MLPMSCAASSPTRSPTSRASVSSGTRTRSPTAAAFASASSRNGFRPSTERSTSRARACGRAAILVTVTSPRRTSRRTASRTRSPRSATTRRLRVACSLLFRRSGLLCSRRSSRRAGSSSAGSAAWRRAPAFSSNETSLAMSTSGRAGFARASVGAAGRFARIDAIGVNRLGMIHGRFQPFHNGHLEYLRGAAALSDELFVGITNPDPRRIKEEPSDPLRHLPESNPFTYVERLLMIEAVAEDERIRAHVIPFPVNEPELWTAYVPAGVTQYLRLFSEWGGTKLERMRDAGYRVVVLDEGADKQVSGVDVREALRAGADWEALVPPGVARVIRSLERVPV